MLSVAGVESLLVGVDVVASVAAVVGRLVFVLVSVLVVPTFVVFGATETVGATVSVAVVRVVRLDVVVLGSADVGGLVAGLVAVVELVVAEVLLEVPVVCRLCVFVMEAVMEVVGSAVGFVVIIMVEEICPEVTRVAEVS